MNNKICVIKNLIRIQLKTERLINNLMFSMLFFVFISYLLINSLLSETYKLKLDINIWDGIFTIVTQPSFIIFIYLPVFLLSTSVLLSRHSFSKYLIIRCSKKSWILSRIACQLIINLVFNLIFFILILLLSLSKFKFENDWSKVIKNTEAISRLSTKLYPNNFVLDMSPYTAIFCTFIGILLSTCIITLLRDLFMEFIQNIIIANLMIILYIGINFILFVFPLKNLLGNVFAYISLYNVSMIWWHKFRTLSAGPYSLNIGLLSGAIFTASIIIFRVLLSRKMVIEYD